MQDVHNVQGVYLFFVFFFLISETPIQLRDPNLNGAVGARDEVAFIWGSFLPG